MAVAKAPVKTYVLKSPPLSASIPQLCATYWKLAKQVEALGVSRHALTQKALGGHPKVSEMSAEQLGKILTVFSAIIRDATHKGDTQ